MTVTGKLEVTIKFSEFPEAKTVENGWKSFEVDCDGQLISITVKPSFAPAKLYANRHGLSVRADIHAGRYQATSVPGDFGFNSTTAELARTV